jgi:hypothetical protein
MTIEEIEEIIEWNLSFGISAEKSIENLELEGIDVSQKIKDWFKDIITH